MREMLRKVGGQTGWQLLGKLVTSLSTIILLSVITRSFGEQGVGVYTLAITYLGFFYLAADLGVNAYGVRFLEKNEAVFQKILGFRIIFSLLLIIAAIAGSVFFVQNEPLVTFSILIGSISIIGNAVFTSTNLVFQTKLRYDLSILSTILSAVVSLGLIILISYLHLSLPYLIVGHTLGWLLCAVLALILVKRFFSIRPQFDLFFVQKMLRDVWPISLTLLLNVVYFRIDTFIITFTHGITAVGVYNLAYQFFSNALVFPTFMMNALYPLFIKTHQQSERLLFPFIIKASLVMGLIGLSGTVLTYTLSPFLIKLVAGESGFEGSVDALRILSFSFPAFFLSAVLMWGLVTLHLNKRMLGVYLIGLLTNLTLNALFIPEYSFIAASWVTVFCEYLILLLQLLILMHYFRGLR